jgi:hypothetical protein
MDTRGKSDRRKQERRGSPGDALDVSRVEHENLCAQVDKHDRAIQRLEAQVRSLTDADRLKLGS